MCRPENPDAVIPLNAMDCEMYQIIRKDGIYYNAKDHRKLGLNKYNIPLEEKTGIFSEGSVQDQIKIQVEALPNHIYSIQFICLMYTEMFQSQHIL